MHDTFLFKKIAESLKDLCENCQIVKITHLKISVHHDSHVNDKSLLSHLKELIPTLLDENASIEVEASDDVEELQALINEVEGIKDETILM